MIDALIKATFHAIIEKLTRRTNFIKSVFTAEGGAAAAERRNHRHTYID
jgi:hypothetical protein